MAQRRAERSADMIDITPEYLRSLRTLTAAEVDVRARERARFDLTPAERLDNTTHRAAYEGARH